MTKVFVYSTALAAGLILPSAAVAQSPPSSCPPGSWFCVQPPDAQAAPPGGAVQPVAPLPSAGHDTPPAPPPPSQAGAPPAPSVTPGSPPPPSAQPGPYGPPPPPPLPEYQSPPGWAPPRPLAPPPYAYPYLPEYDAYAPPPPPPPLPAHEWGLNLHVAAAAIGRGAARDAGMGGAGVGLRFKPVRRFGIEADADYYGGTDYSGNTRNEEAFTLNGLLFINPRSRAQAYIVAGLGLSTVHVSCDPSAGCGGGAFDAQYGYFGGQAGAGLELRLGRAFALNADLRGFLRTRIDSGAQSQPEFVDAFGHTSNTSAGALFTAGMTFYF